MNVIVDDHRPAGRLARILYLSKSEVMVGRKREVFQGVSFL